MEPNFAQDFYFIVNELGTFLYIDFKDDSRPAENRILRVKASLVPATQAAYNVTDREYLFKGDMMLPDMPYRKRLTGQYYTQPDVPNKKYMLLSVIPNAIHINLAYIYSVQCNDVVNIYHPDKEVDQYLNRINVYRKKHRNVDCYFTTTTRSPKMQNDGLLDQTIYTISMPAKYMLAPMQRISRKEFVQVFHTDEDGTSYYKTEFTDVNYQVDSVDMALVDKDPKTGMFVGVVSAQLSKDLRDWKNVE